MSQWPRRIWTDCPFCVSVFLLLVTANPWGGNEARAETESHVTGAKASGYYRYPTIHEDRIVFVAEDDLWEVPASGGIARRLTTNLSTVTSPHFSPDGKWIAFIGSEEGPQEVFLMPSAGGTVRRLTFLGSRARVVGWQDNRVVFTSTHGRPLRHPGWLHRIAVDGTALERLPYGPANRIAESEGIFILGRKNRDPARWKRYRGGRAGEIWIDLDGSGNFKELIELDGNLADPIVIGDRIYFLSDHEGIGNVYSCTPQGTDLQRHTDHRNFYARNAATDGKRIVYHSRADLYLLDPKTDTSTKVGVDFRSPRVQRNRKFVEAKEYLEDFALSSDGSRLALVCRGRSIAMGCWEGAVHGQGAPHGVRYRLVRFLNDGKRVVLASDEGGQDHLEIHFLDNSHSPKEIEVKDLGRPMEIKVSPASDEIALTNHRNQILHIDLETEKAVVIDQDKYALLGGFDWSPGGEWIAYGCSTGPRQSVIKVFDVENGKVHQITGAVRWDLEPSFDLDGEYLFFLSKRIFNPVYDNLHFDAGFPRGMRPYLVTLRKDIPSPFLPEPKGFGKEEKESDGEEESEGDKEKEEETEEEPIGIDFDGIEDRIIPFPIEEGLYQDLGAVKDRVFYTTLPVEGALGSSWFERKSPPKATLKVYDLKKREEKTLAPKVSNFKLASAKAAVAIRAGDRLRVVAADSKELSEKEEPSRESGWIDLSRPKVAIEPTAEWKQMFREAWRLQRDYFWTEDLSAVDWEGVFEKYLPLVDRIASRHEFADLLWEMQGELGTSHAYEMLGDYRKGPYYKQGFLGADFSYDPEQEAWRIDRIVSGDTWDPKNAPPLLAPGVNITEEMLLMAVGGQKTTEDVSPYELLVNAAETEVSLTVAEPDGSATRTVTVKTLRGEQRLRYRDWVERNRQTVHEKTDGTVGYLHIPDMGAFGYSEFHRYFLTELDHDGLIVDVRYNGGGHVSQLVLEKLARRRIGYTMTRWMGVLPYPDDAPKGPMVCLTNEGAGSDGDIFSHGFRALGLGKLIGRRTWGGVIGVWPRNFLVDGTMTTQPEFSHWFKDVGWNIENYGVEPDIEVDILPQDWIAGRDPQLERGIEEVLKEIEANPPEEPELSDRPDLGGSSLPLRR